MLRAVNPIKKTVTAVLASLLLHELLFYYASPAAEIGAGVISLLFGLPYDGEGAWLIYEILYMLLYALSFLLPSMLLVMLARGRVGELTQFRCRFDCNPGPAAVITLGIVTAVSYLSNLFWAMLDVLGVGFYMGESYFPESVPLILVYFLSSVVVPAFVEEIAYRGVVLRVLLPYGKWFAIITSGVLFGLMHSNPTQILYATAAGVTMAYFVLEAKSLWLSVAIHGLNNALSFLGHWFYDCISEETYYAFYALYDGGIVALAAIALMVMLWQKNGERRSWEYPSASRREMVSAFITPVCGIYVIITLLLTAQWMFLY